MDRLFRSDRGKSSNYSNGLHNLLGLLSFEVWSGGGFLVSGAHPRVSRS